MKSLLAVPIPGKEGPVGVLSIESTQNAAFDEEDASFIAPYLNLLNVAIDPNEVERQLGLYETIAQMRQEQVLVLGKDVPPESELLVRITGLLRQRGYIPLLVKAHPDFRELSNEEKVRVFADVSRFVLIENTFPAGQIAECKICAQNRIVAAMLRQSGRGSSYMVTDYERDFDFIREFEYRDTPESLERSVSAAVEWAESKIRERAEFFDSKYPWRTRPERGGSQHS